MRKLETKYRKALSEKESRILSELSYKNKGLFTVADLKEYVADPRNFLHHLVEKNWILKIRSGVYLIAPLEAGEGGASTYTLHSFAIASVLVKPYYIGYLSALNFHGLTDRVPPSVYVATTKFRHPKEILGTRFVFIKIHQRKMFGIDEIEIEKMPIRISAPEKTIIDCMDHPEYCGGIEEVAKAFYFSRDELDTRNVVDYAVKIGNAAVIKRLGYIAEVFGWNDYLRYLSAVKLKSGYSYLDPRLPKKGAIREKWKIIVNASIDPKRWEQ
jgi:predicted transcriptional regulator of viral defense system